MSRKVQTQQDLREVPAYSIAEAAGYLHMPKTTLRAWMLGQNSFRPVIEIADRRQRRLSFINLVEAFVLAGIVMCWIAGFDKAMDGSRDKLAEMKDYLVTEEGKKALAETQQAYDRWHGIHLKMAELTGGAEEAQSGLAYLHR
jgi:hypothetical protein